VLEGNRYQRLKYTSGIPVWQTRKNPDVTQQFKIVLKEARDAKHEKFNMVTKIFLHKP
jgi:hypothetical protein